MGYLNYGNRELVRKARSLRNSMTRAEIMFWTRIRSKQVWGLKFRRQQPICEYIVDFYCDSIKLIIEIDGEIHNNPAINQYDKIRETALRDHGYQILRFVNNEVEFNLDTVLNKLNSFLEKNYPELYSERSKINEK